MKVPVLLGGIAGDIIGSRFESFNTRRTNFRLFGKRSRYTDDTVLTIAVADALLSGVPYEVRLKEYALRYPEAGYGDLFMSWVRNKGTTSVVPISYGSGAAMRVAPISYWYDDIKKVSVAADDSAIITHKRGEGFYAASRIARVIYRARRLKNEVRSQFLKFCVLGHDIYLDTDVIIGDLNSPHEMDLHANTVVSHAAYAFYHGHDYESVIRLAISIGGDSDTIANIAGAIAYAFYNDMPKSIYTGVLERLPQDFIRVIDSFEKDFQMTGIDRDC